MGRLINGIPGSHLLISSLPDSALSQQAFPKPCLVNLISKDTHILFSTYLQKFGDRLYVSSALFEMYKYVAKFKDKVVALSKFYYKKVPSVMLYVSFINIS